MALWGNMIPKPRDTEDRSRSAFGSTMWEHAVHVRRTRD